MALLRRFLALDRRLVYVLVVLAVGFPIVRPLALPGLSLTPLVKGFHAQIDALPPGANLLIAFDFDPSSMAEMEPQARALVRHALGKGLDVVAVTLWPTGQPIAESVMRECGKEAGAAEGERFAILSWQPGRENVITGMGEDIPRFYPKDARGKPTLDLPVMRDIKILKDFQYMICLTAGAEAELWMTYATDKHKVPYLVGCTSVTSPGIFPYLGTGQVRGLLNGLKGAAEYEKLIGRKASGTLGMDSVCLGAFLVLLLVLGANVAAFVVRRAGGAS